MNYFEIKNADDILTINDNESCLYLKYRINLKNLPLHDRRVESGFEYLYKGDGIAYINTPRGTYQAAMYIPIRLRKPDEYYAYALSCSAPLRHVRLTEIRNQRHPDRIDHWTNYLQVTFECDRVEDIRKITDSIEIYVYSSRMPKTGTSGLEVFDKYGVPMYNSNLPTLRIAQIIRKEFNSDTLLSKVDYEMGTIKFQGIKKPGMCYVYPILDIHTPTGGYAQHYINWNGDSVIIDTNYRGEVGTPLDPQSVKTTQVLICELDGTENVPSTDEMEI
uniref:Uncharacterized protein n=1 Tax=Myoviridae sp. ct0mD26 TaxID=2825015 RepID=A0A8S5UEP6_9CAUD|nr:MAG TPA: hypothetical protein [Myoviridae sp. ct0mD26]